ncbi:MAG: NAD-dependent protein deacylase [Planctomycetaceae bacterium]|nr:NAD-dependent protein deacylase [Planctomycetaceae bacterium]
MNSSSLPQIACWLNESRSAVVLTGAGISTESGIPDFRSPGGIWSRYRTVYYDEFMTSVEGRREYWRQKSEAHREFFDSQPNAGHKVLAKWEQAGRLQAVITQNIDGLHQLAGNQTVYELHGTARFIKCQDCAAMYDADPLVRQYLKTNQLPICEACGKDRLKHATVSFGQMLPEEVLESSIELCRGADLIFAIGSSLVVTPAANLPLMTKQAGGKLVIINRDETGLDDYADAVINAGIGETLTAIDELLEKSSRAKE